MIIKHIILGECELEIEHGRYSSVDSYLAKGYSLTLDRELTDTELDWLQNEYAGEIQDESYSNGYSPNHN